MRKQSASLPSSRCRRAFLASSPPSLFCIRRMAASIFSRLMLPYSRVMYSSRSSNGISRKRTGDFRMVYQSGMGICRLPMRWLSSSSQIAVDPPFSPGYELPAPARASARTFSNISCFGCGWSVAPNAEPLCLARSSRSITVLCWPASS